MPINHSSTYGRNYTLKRNLLRPVLEKHSIDHEHWICVEPDCAKTFIWRTTLAHHLITIYGYTKIRVGEFFVRGSYVVMFQQTAIMRILGTMTVCLKL